MKENCTNCKRGEKQFSDVFCQAMPITVYISSSALRSEGGYHNLIKPPESHWCHCYMSENEPPPEDEIQASEETIGLWDQIAFYQNAASDFDKWLEKEHKENGPYIGVEEVIAHFRKGFIK